MGKFLLIGKLIKLAKHPLKTCHVIAYTVMNPASVKVSCSPIMILFKILEVGSNGAPSSTRYSVLISDNPARTAAIPGQQHLLF